VYTFYGLARVNQLKRVIKLVSMNTGSFLLEGEDRKSGCVREREGGMEGGKEGGIDG
jgi:hypothetical protein